MVVVNIDETTTVLTLPFGRTSRSGNVFDNDTDLRGLLLTSFGSIGP